MTFGQQNSMLEAHEQIDYAIDQGVNFIDTAELYPIPRNPETQGETEKQIGSWLKKNNRDQLIIASKVTGPGPNLSYIGDNLLYTKSRIQDALQKSLTRLQTDYIDIYQWHWPERNTNCFGIKNYTSHDNKWVDNFLEGISTMDNLIKEGKIRYWGVSNETPWGIMRIRELCKEGNFSPPITIQNPYNLLNRTFEIGLSEISMHTGMKLLAYSPLAFGLLSGKYHKQLDLPFDRLNQFLSLSRYNNALSKQATSLYIEIAENHGLSPSQLALAFVNSRPWICSTIIGATKMSQLKENISTYGIELSSDVLKEIELVYQTIPDPAP